VPRKVSSRRDRKDVSERIIFLGTGGARIVVAKQVRASGGMWVAINGTNLLLDPGPGCLVKSRTRKEKLDATKLDAILLSHKHLDHSGDVNTMIEAMTDGGFRPKGMLFAPAECLESDPVVLRYVRDYVDEIHELREGGHYTIGRVTVSTPIRHQHGNAETYGMVLTPSGQGPSVAYIADTRYFPELADAYRGDILILNVVFLTKRDYDHLCVEDALKLIRAIQPKLAVITHFGMTVIRAKPWEVAAELESAAGTRVIAARDGMTLDLHLESEPTA
jgi:ribonuclease BN (tRNA processing enzyme)